MAKHLEELFIPDVLGSLGRIEAALTSVKPDTRPGEVSFANSNLQPPSQFYVQNGMQLRLRSVTSQTSEVLTLNALILFENRLTTLAGSTPAFTSTTNTTTVRITTTGFLVSAAITAAIAAYRGQTYCTLELLDQTGNFLCTLFSSYVTTAKPVSYPPIFIEDPTSGFGYTTRKVGTITPGGGGGPDSCFFAVPANRAWRFLAVNFTILNSAAPGNRLLVLSVTKQPGGQAGFWLSIQTSIANENYQEIFTTDSNQVNQSAFIGFPLIQNPFHALLLQTSDLLSLNITNGQIGDTIQNDIALIEEYVTL